MEPDVIHSRPIASRSLPEIEFITKNNFKPLSKPHITPI